jgi:hypothetical protein
MNQQRLQAEKLALDFGFPKRYVIQDLNTGHAYIDLGLRTNANRTYRLKILLGDFPYSKPEVYVVYPKNLRDYNGYLLSDIGVSAEMHLLQPDEDDNIQLCHYSDKVWHSNVTLYKVALKCLVWLNAYDGHLRTGEPLDYYLKHQPLF